MDWASLIPGLVASLPQGSAIVAVLAWVVIREKVVAGDRVHWQSERTAWTVEMDKVRKGRDSEVKRLEDALTKLREENDGLEEKLDKERDRRRIAEDGHPTQQLPPYDPPWRAS